MKDTRRYYAEGSVVYDRTYPLSVPYQQKHIGVAACDSHTMASRIANALNLYRPKVRRRKSAEKQQSNVRG